jgi:O-antigen ligase
MEKKQFLGWAFFLSLSLAQLHLSFCLFVFFWAVVLVALIPVFGQFFRFPLGSGEGILVSDIVIPIVVCAWIFSSLRTCGAKRNREAIQTKHTLSIDSSLRRNDEREGGSTGGGVMWKRFLDCFVVPSRNDRTITTPTPLKTKSGSLIFFLFFLFGFLAVALASLFFAGIWMPIREILESGFYLFRFLFLVLFGFVVSDTLNTKRQILIFSLALFAGGFLLSLLGFVQLALFPDFTQMQQFGWDPHIGRLLSTWFDPNFLAGYFAFLLSILAGLFLFAPSFKYKIFLIIFSLPVFLAFLLTYSRSGLVALAVSFLLLGIFFARKMLLFGICFLFLLLPFFPRALDRAEQGVQSVASFVQQEEAIFLPDATARLRITNWQEGIKIFEEHPWFGVGFNTLRFLRSENIHSSGGFDSSLLTVATTTGIIGLFFFIAMIISLFLMVFSCIKSEGHTTRKGIAMGIFCGSIGLLAHSFFVNSLFFPLLFISILSFFGLVFAKGWNSSS